MSQSERSKQYAATAKGKAAIIRKREREKEKRQSSIPLASGAAPAPTVQPVKKYKTLTKQQEADAFNYLWEHRSHMEAIEYMSNRRNEELDKHEHDLKIILNDPRTTAEEKAGLEKALDGAIERYRCLSLWLRSTFPKDSEHYRAETPKERMVRLSHKLYMDDGDEDFVREMLLKSLESATQVEPQTQKPR